MTKRIICLFLAVLMFAAIPFATALAAGEDEPYVIGKETMEQICQKKGLDYNFCKDAIVKLNGWADESAFTTLTVGSTIKIPKTNQDAALILGKDLPAGLLPKSEAETIDYVVKDKDTMISICKDKGLDYSKCKDAILKLNGWSDYNLLTMHTGDKIKLPKTNADAAVIIAKSSSTTPSGITPLTPTDGAVAAYMVPYVVKTGDTLYGICLANGIDFSRYINLIMQASGLKSATIYTGDVIFLPSSTASSGSMSIVTHVVKGGETVYGICQSLGLNYNASIGMITSLNPNKNLSNIHAGDVLFFPKGSGTTPSGGGTTPGGGGSGDGGGYVPASGDPPVTQTVPKAKEGFNFALEEVTIKTDDTVYNLLKAKGMDAQYFNYYISIMLTANNRGTFSNLKDGEKILITTNNSAASIVIKGVKVKDGDTVIKMCETAHISYNDNVTLINKLNSSLNFSNLKTGDIVLLPFKS